jgi:hypothetical protein
MLMRGGRLFQQFLVDMFCKMEQNNMRFIRQHQQELRCELYQGLADAFFSGDHDASQIGRRIILPSSVTGSARNMGQLYQDSMAIVRKYGKPDLFVTMTCNPNWTEIHDALLPGQKSFERPDLLARIFNQKLKQLLDDLLEKNVLGKVLVKMHVIEFQKRGLPHAHLLLILDKKSKPTTAEDIDAIVSADIPDPSQYPLLYKMVKDHMLHGPCGPKCENEKGNCSKHFPKDFCPETVSMDDSYPIYKRTSNETIEKRLEGKDILFDSRWVVPYNPYLLTKYNCHMNVEVCSSVTSIKYIHKYCFKGGDRAMAKFQTEGIFDEIQVSLCCLKNLNESYTDIVS